MKKQSIPDVGPEVWVERVHNLFSDQRGFSKTAQKKFALAILRNIPIAYELKDRVMPDNSDLIDVKKHLLKLENAAIALQKQRKNNPYFLTLENMLNTQSNLSDNDNINVDKILEYTDQMLVLLEASRAVSSKPGVDNRLPLVICMIVCEIYESYFGKPPTLRDGDYITQSGDIMDGTPYERVCLSLAELMNIKISWSTCKSAVENYKDGIPVMIFVNGNFI